MRRSLGVSTALILIGCGGGTEPVAPPPPPPPPAAPGPPAALVAQSGDGQKGEPGQPVATAPIVVVRDAGGRAVAGATVAFVVDSGGGSVATAGATSGPDGTASPGNWTLGPSEGRNVLLASVGAVTLRLSATATYDGIAVGGGTVPPRGGRITIARPGSPLDGLAIAVPDSAFSTPTAITLGTRSSAGLSLPAGPPPSANRRPAAPAGVGRAPEFVAVTPIITLTVAGPPIADAPIEIEIPVGAAAGSEVVVAVVDSNANPLVFLPVVARTTTSLTVAIRGIDAAYYALGTAPLEGDRHTLGFVVFATASEQSLAALLPYPVRSAFVFGLHDWEFPDLRTAYFPRTDVGMALSEWAAMTVYPSGIHGQFRRQDGIPTSNTGGIMLSAGLAHNYYAYLGRYGGAWIAFYAHADPIQFHRNAALAIYWRLFLSPAPVPLLLTDGVDSRLVLVIGWDPSTESFQIRDPAYPGQPRTLAFVNGVMAPYQDPYTPTIQYTLPYVDVTAAYGLWYPATVGLAGLLNPTGPEPYEDRWPGAGYATWGEVLTGASRLVPDTVFVSADTTRIWPTSFNAPFGVPTSLPLDPGWSLQTAHVARWSGQAWVLDPSLSGTSMFLDAAGSGGPWIEASLAVDLERFEGAAFDSISWLGWRRIDVVKYGARVADQTGDTGAPITFSIGTDGGPALPAAATYRWDFGDGTGPVETTGPRDVTHSYDEQATHAVTVDILHPATGRQIGRATATATVGVPLFAWRVDSVRVLSEGGDPPPGDGISPQSLATVTGVVTRLQTVPTDATIFVFPTKTEGGGIYQGVYLQQVETGMGIQEFDPNHRQYYTLAAKTGFSIGSFTNIFDLIGTLSAGAVSGAGLWTLSCNIVAGRIDAGFDGNRLAGTMGLTLVWDGGGIYDFSLQVWASRIFAAAAPPPILTAARPHRCGAVWPTRRACADRRWAGPPQAGRRAAR
ncbi:MAG: PKD domain-containing protein [Gemmatimonadales bacterium]